MPRVGGCKRWPAKLKMRGVPPAVEGMRGMAVSMAVRSVRVKESKVKLKADFCVPTFKAK